jgi:hypothetical protein
MYKMTSRESNIYLIRKRERELVLISVDTILKSYVMDLEANSLL